MAVKNVLNTADNSKYSPSFYIDAFDSKRIELIQCLLL